MLNRDPEWVIRAFERGEVSQTEATLAQYVKALVAMDRLDHSKLMSQLSRGVGGGIGSRTMQEAALRRGGGRGGSQGDLLGGGGNLLGGGGMGAKGGEYLGSEKNPIYMSTAEPTAKTQFWKTIRGGIMWFIAAACVGALLETSPGGAGGLSRGLMGGSPEPQPAQVSNVTFKDVKVRPPRQSAWTTCAHLEPPPPPTTT
jgi:hypothetical protein